jgi:hypothetical protein
VTLSAAEQLGHIPLSELGGGTTAAVDMSRRASSSYRAWDGSQQVVMPECRCVCGGRLVAETPAESDILAAVQIHNALPQHVGWRERRR